MKKSDFWATESLKTAICARLICMNNKMKTAIIAVIIAVLVALTAGVIYYVKNKMTVYDKDGMVYESTEIHEQEDD